uniref:Uncharacterized protein n=1 Tax=Panagrolaimus davidi TaxID=227884 RepID=A0A914PPS5_9BILA
MLFFSELHENSAAETITAKTVEELIKIPHFSNLDEFYLDEIPDTFEIETFFEYIKKNKKTKFWFEFSDKIFVDYQLRLDRIVQEIVFSENHGYKPPWILYKGVSHRKELHELFFLHH